MFYCTHSKMLPLGAQQFVTGAITVKEHLCTLFSPKSLLVVPFTQTEKLLKIYSPSGPTRCSYVCFIIRTDLEEFSITSFTHQRTLYSEWVPSEWEFKQLIKNITIIHKWSTWPISSTNVLWNERLHVCRKVEDHCNIFISCLNSHSDGTHSLQRIS